MHLVRRIIPNAIISITTQNFYEYPGIRRVWDLGQQIRLNESYTSLILYFHSKGMYNYDDYSEVRGDWERELYRSVIDPWRNVSEIFQTMRHVNKVGYKSSKLGFMWMNFWWARASYVRMLVCPIIIEESKSSERYYYEQWVCMVDDNRIWPHVESVHFPNDRRIYHGIPSGKDDNFALVPNALIPGTEDL